MHHDVAALEDRIARLEQELEDVRTRPEPRPAATPSLWAWWERHGRRVLFTLTLVALAAPTAVWMQARHETRMLAMAQKHEAKLILHRCLHASNAGRGTGTCRGRGTGTGTAQAQAH